MMLISETEIITFLTVHFQVVGFLYEDVIGIKTKSEDASNLIRDEQIRKYITNYLTPLITQCVAFDSTTSLALVKGKDAFKMSMNAQNLAEETSKKILLLASNVDKIHAIHNPDLESLSQSMIRVRSTYTNINLNASMEKLKKTLINEKEKLKILTIKKNSLNAVLRNYELLYKSLAVFGC